MVLSRVLDTYSIKKLPVGAFPELYPSAHTCVFVFGRDFVEMDKKMNVWHWREYHFLLRAEVKSILNGPSSRKGFEEDRIGMPVLRISYLSVVFLRSFFAPSLNHLHLDLESNSGSVVSIGMIIIIICLSHPFLGDFNPHTHIYLYTMWLWAEMIPLCRCCCCLLEDRCCRTCRQNPLYV